MTELLAYPFRITPGLRVDTVDGTTDEAVGQQLHVLILTSPGERPLVPAFGIPDPTFQGLKAEDIRAGVELFGPPVTIVDVVASDVRQGFQQAEVRYQ